MNHLTQILIVDRFAPLRTHLLALLNGLDKRDWDIDRQQARAQSVITGNADLASSIFSATAIIG